MYPKLVLSSSLKWPVLIGTVVSVVSPVHSLKVMWFKVVLLALSFSQLGLGAAQECKEGFRGVLGVTLENVLDVVFEKLNSTMEKIVDVAIERRLATALQVIANISNSMSQDNRGWSGLQ